MTDRDLPTSFNPDRPNQLPPELAAFLRHQQYAALLHATDLGTALIVKAPGHEIASARGRVPIGFNHELYDHPASPVIRMVTRIYDQPDRHLAFETFVNAGDPDQRADYQALSRQDELVLLFYDESLSHALSKRVRLTEQPRLLQVLTTADRLLAAIPEPQRNFDAAKADVMGQTGL
jgi:hypothetical protein